LLGDILDEVLEFRIGEHVAREDARHFVPGTTHQPFRALQRDHCLVDDVLGQVVFVDGHAGLPFPQLVEVSAAAGHVREPFR
jgi:hypothetical protein